MLQFITMQDGLLSDIVGPSTLVFASRGLGSCCLHLSVSYTTVPRSNSTSMHPNVISAGDEHPLPSSPEHPFQHHSQVHNQCLSPLASLEAFGVILMHSDGGDMNHVWYRRWTKVAHLKMSTL